VPAVLVTPGKVKKMKKTTIKWLLLLLLPGLLFACSGAKTVVKEEPVPSEEVEVDENQLKQEEQKQMEFEYLFVEALKEKALGNNQQAIQLLSGCLEIDPNSSAAMYELATIHAENNDLTSASLLLEKAISLNPENKWYNLLLAEIYQQTRRFNQAAGIYDQLIQQEPENLEYLFMKAAVLSNTDLVTQAIDAYNQLEEKIGINEQVSVAKQQLLIRNGQAEKAFEEIEQLIETNPGEPKYYGLMADLFQSQGDSANALKYYRKIQEVDPDNGFVYFSLANFYLQNGNLKQSLEEAKKGFRSEDIDIQTKLQLYMLLTSDPKKSGIDSAQEEQLIEILHEVHPEEYLVYTLRAESLLKRGKPSEARTELLKALELEKGDYILWERVLFIDNDLQDWNGLYEHSMQAMELFPNQPQVYFLNAVACIQLEKYDETIAIVEEGLMYVIDNNSLKGQFLMLKGEALYKMGKTGEAFETFDESVELDSNNHIALNNYAYYLSLAGVNLDKAERMSGTVIERFPDNATYLDTYAWVLFKKGEYKLARFYMESALKIGGEDNPTLMEHYGDILFKLQQTEEAIKYWQKARNLGEESDLLERKIRERNYFEE
jgi:tetratricopeptide (TPR) repeat protein